MGIEKHLDTFAGLPVRDFSPRGFLVTDPEAENYLQVDDEHPFDTAAPCAIRLNPDGMFASPLESLGCCLGPVLGLLVSIGWFVAKGGIGESIGAGMLTCIVIFVPWTILDERRRAARMRELQAEMITEFHLEPRGDSRDGVIASLAEQESLLSKCVARLIHCGLAENTTALIVNDEDSRTNFDGLRDIMLTASPCLPKLKALFINELTIDECEISWILNGDCGPFLATFHELEHFQVRGGEIRFIDMGAHQRLQTLIVETGGLDHEAVQDLAAAYLPNLRHLELWTGQGDFGNSCELSHIVELLETQRLEHLTRLAIRNCEFSDELIEWLVRSPLLDRLETLDLSLGCTSDTGAELLVNCPAVRKLKTLDLHYHFITDPWMERLRTLADECHIDLNLDGSQEPELADDDGTPLRYTAIGE